MTEPKKDLPHPIPIEEKTDGFTIAKVAAGAYVLCTSALWTIDAVKKLKGRGR